MIYNFFKIESHWLKRLYLHVLLYFHHCRQMVKVIRIPFYGESIQILHPIFLEPYIFHTHKSGALFHKMPRTPFPVQINLLLNKTWVNQKICQLRKNVNYFQIIVWYLKRYLLICLFGRLKHGLLYFLWINHLFQKF